MTTFNHKQQFDQATRYFMAAKPKKTLAILQDEAAIASGHAGNYVPAIAMRSVSTLDYPYPDLCLLLSKTLAGNANESIEKLLEFDSIVENQHAGDENAIESVLNFKLNLGATLAFAEAKKEARSRFDYVRSQAPTFKNPGAQTSFHLKGALLAHCAQLPDLSSSFMDEAYKAADYASQFDVPKWSLQLRDHCRAIARRISSFTPQPLDLYLHYAHMLKLNDLLQTYDYSFAAFLRSTGRIDKSYPRLIATLIAMLHLKLNK